MLLLPWRSVEAPGKSRAGISKLTPIKQCGAWNSHATQHSKSRRQAIKIFVRYGSPRVHGGQKQALTPELVTVMAL